MSSLKHHLALIIPLLALLFSLESILLIQRALLQYESKLSKAYSIVIASRTELTQESISRIIKEADTLKEIDPQNVLKRLGESMRALDPQTLRNALPKFYTLSLASFPSQARLEAIDAKLRKINDIERVESFIKSHDKVYRLLLLLKGSVVVFSGLILIISLLLMIKQIEIWRFEHSERMEIMSYFGAPSWMRNGVLFRLALVDSLIATMIINSGIAYLSFDALVLSMLSEAGIGRFIFDFKTDSLILFATSITVSILSVWTVILRPKG